MLCRSWNKKEESPDNNCRPHREQRPQAEEGTERANTGTASPCGKAAEKVDPEAQV